MIIGAVVMLISGVYLLFQSEAGGYLFTGIGLYVDASLVIGALAVYTLVLGGLLLTSGVLSFKRKLWGFCLASSILWYWAILPLVFICVRRKEWQS